MATTDHPERIGWWLNELESLGIRTREKFGDNAQNIASTIKDDVKQMFYEEYQKAFNEK
jgi:hypothetical protein